MNTGYILSELRLKKNLSQSELAKILGTTDEDVIKFDKALKRNDVVMSYDGVELTDEEKLQLDGMIRGMLWQRIKDSK